MTVQHLKHQNLCLVLIEWQAELNAVKYSPILFLLALSLNVLPL